MVTDDQIKYCDWKAEIILKVWDIRQTSRFSNLFIFMDTNMLEATVLPKH